MTPLKNATGIPDKDNSKNFEIKDAIRELERGIYAALETYSNVHRGSGHNSMVSTHLYEQARRIILEYLGLSKNKYTVIFCTSRRAEALKSQLDPNSYRILSGRDTGLSLGVTALAVKRKALPEGPPLQTGGGTARLVSKEWEIWSDAPGRFEAGTPAIINIIAFAKALHMIQQSGKDIFMHPEAEIMNMKDILYHDEMEGLTGKELLDKLRTTLIGRGTPVPTMEGIKPFTNLDNSASTPTFTPIWNTFRKTLPQSEKIKQELIQETRSICEKSLNAPPTDYEVIFTSNATEAINLVAESLSHESGEDTEPVLISTLLEHSSNDLPWRMLPGYSLIRLFVDDEGFMDLGELDKLLNEYNRNGQHGKKRIKLVAVSGASNVLGVCNSIEEISRIVHSHGARLLVDAAQLVAHRKVDMKTCGIDYLAFSAHKVYAPFGCGVLMARKGLLSFSTEELELIRTSGEENPGGIAALGKSLLLLQQIGMDLICKEEQELTSHMLRGMTGIPGLKIYGVKDPDSPRFSHKIGVIVFTLEKMMSPRTATELALQSGIGIRYGCHCAHIIVKRLVKITPFLEGFQKLILTLFPKLQLPGVARVSLGLENNAEDVDNLIRALRKIAGRNSPAGKSHSANDGTTMLSRAKVQKQISGFIHAAAIRVYS
jgi:selenocysteine lyase/cysteine desulfurase